MSGASLDGHLLAGASLDGHLWQELVGRPSFGKSRLGRSPFSRSPLGRSSFGRSQLGRSSQEGGALLKSRNTSNWTVGYELEKEASKEARLMLKSVPNSEANLTQWCPPFRDVPRWIFPSLIALAASFPPCLRLHQTTQIADKPSSPFSDEANIT